MEQSPENLSGMGVADAKEYILQYATTLKLTEKKHGELAGELEKWRSRVKLARSRGSEDLALAAQGQADKLQAERDSLAAEIAGLKAQIQRMGDQLPGLAARERSVDPDLLEQELRIALGEDLGDAQGDAQGEAQGEVRGDARGADGKADLDRRFKAAEADAALEALKTKMQSDGKP